MQSWFYLFTAITLKSFPLLALWANPVVESNLGEPLVVMHNDGGIRVVSEKDFGPNHIVKASTYDNQLNEWTLPINLSVADLDAKQYRLATDPKGNAVVIWQVADGDSVIVQASCFDRATNAWLQIKDLSQMSRDVKINHLGMDEAGNAFASWTEKLPKYDLMWTATYSKDRDQWTRSRAMKLDKEDEDGLEVMLDSAVSSLVVRNKKTKEAFVVSVDQAPVELLERVTSY
jgi:hypothetical protein